MQSLLAGLSGPSSSIAAGGQPSTAGPSATDDQATKLQDLFGKMMAGDQVDEDELDSLLGGINGDTILKELGGAAGLSGGGDAEDSSAATPSVPPPPPPTLTSPSAVDTSPKAGSSAATPTQAGPSRQNATLTFDETIDRTLKNLKQSAEKAKVSGDYVYNDSSRRVPDNPAAPGQASASSSTNPSTSDPFSALLSQLSSLDPSSLDPSLLEALNASGGLDDGDGSNDADIGKMLDGMMRQLMSREVLEEPLSELAEKVSGGVDLEGFQLYVRSKMLTLTRRPDIQYPPYIESHPDLPAADKTKYSTQLGLIQEILAIFKEPGFTDDPADGDVVGKARKDKVASLMGQVSAEGDQGHDLRARD
jgi:peroxin-19